MAELHRETLDHYRALDGFDLPAEPAGVLVLAREREPRSRRSGAPRGPAAGAATS